MKKLLCWVLGHVEGPDEWNEDSLVPCVFCKRCGRDLTYDLINEALKK